MTLSWCNWPWYIWRGCFGNACRHRDMSCRWLRMMLCDDSVFAIGNQPATRLVNNERWGFQLATNEHTAHWGRSCSEAAPTVSLINERKTMRIWCRRILAKQEQKKKRIHEWMKDQNRESQENRARGPGSFNIATCLGHSLTRVFSRRTRFATKKATQRTGDQNSVYVLRTYGVVSAFRWYKISATSMLTLSLTNCQRGTANTAVDGSTICFPIILVHP